ncbi:Gfo/Idh/MocA family protein [Halobacteriaceae archaeon GCM10025711]
MFDLDELLAMDLDLVHVCTPVQTHLPIARSAIEAGVATLVEKPVTENREELEELQSLADRHDVPVSVVHQHLFDPAVRKARRRIQDGSLGEIRGVNLLYLGLTRPDEANRGTWVFDLPGGEFEEGLPHPIYLTLGTGGYPRDESGIQTLTTLVGDYGGKFSYDNAQVQYATESGALCSVTMSSRGQPERLLHIQGEEGSLLIDLVTQSTVPVTRNYTGSPVNKARKNIDGSMGLVKGLFENVKLVAENSYSDDWESAKRLRPHYYQIDAMVEAVRRGTEPPIPLEEAWWTMTVMQAIRDASTEQPVETMPVD